MFAVLAAANKMAGVLNILICEDDALYQQSLRLWLGKTYKLTMVTAANELTQYVQTCLKLNRAIPEIILLDLHLQQHGEGFKLLTFLKVHCPTQAVVVHSASADYASIVQAMQLGATDYLPKGLPPEIMYERLQNIAQRCALSVPHSQSQSAAMIQIETLLARIKHVEGHVVIQGESGVGKEIAARGLAVDAAPFVAVDAATIQQSMAESILFGHERGAFTGADTARCGLLEQANGGVLYIDEITNMPLDIQAKLLRALQEKEITRLGAAKPKLLSFRVICATNQDMATCCAKGQFRSDLFARLNVFNVTIPPLRARREDILPLFDGFLKRYGQGRSLHVGGAVQHILLHHAWPHNIRELANVAQYVIALCDGSEVLPCHLPSHMSAHTPTEGPLCKQEALSVQLRQFEKHILSAVYRELQGNILSMSKRLKIDRSQLYDKLKKHGIYHP